jgi:DNA-binding PadR family transcriptional regulator
LGLLSFGREHSAYEVKQFADASLRFFYWAPAMSQVYAGLDRLEADGLVASRDVQGNGTRTTRVFRITRAGEAELRRWLEESPVEPPVLKHSVALRVFFGHLADPAQLRAVVEEYRRSCEQMLAELDAVLAEIGTDPRFRYARLVAKWGEHYYGSEADAAGRLRSRLRARS